MRKKRIVLQIPVAYNGITSCVVTLREMEKKFFDILRIVQKNPVFGKTLMCGGMLAVSYTHLTLPTKRIVEILVVADSIKKKKEWITE